MATLLPPDPRAKNNFDIVRGWETMDRRDFVFSDTQSANPLTLEVGEPVRYLHGQDGVVKIDGTSDYICGLDADGERVAGISFSKYDSSDIGSGFPDTYASGKVTVLQGKFSARFNNENNAFFISTGVTGITTPAVGLDVVAVYDNDTKKAYYACIPGGATRYGTISASSAAYDQCVIGKVSEISGDWITVDFNL